MLMAMALVEMSRSTEIVVWLFIGTQERFSGPPLCHRLMDEEHSRPRSLIYPHATLLKMQEK